MDIVGIMDVAGVTDIGVGTVRHMACQGHEVKNVHWDVPLTCNSKKKIKKISSLSPLVLFLQAMASADSKTPRVCKTFKFPAR